MLIEDDDKNKDGMEIELEDDEEAQANALIDAAFAAKKNDDEEEPEPVDDEEEPAPEEEDDEEDDDQKQFSEQVQKRFDKLTFQRREEERKRLAAEKRADELDKRLRKIEEDREDDILRDFEDQMSVVKTNLKQAIERGDTDKQVELQDQLAEMKAAKIAADRYRKARKDQPAQPAQAVDAPPIPAAALSWASKNKWFSDPLKQAEAQIAMGIDARLEAEGSFDREDPEYYEELDRRLQAVIPDVYTDVRKTPPKREQKKTAPVAPATPSSKRNTKRVTLSKADLQLAQELGINTPEGLKAFAKEKANA